MEIRGYEGEHELALMTALIERDLSEPYSIYTYRYFLHNWPDLSFLAFEGELCVGVIISKLDSVRMRGYIAMLAVNPNYRKRGIGSLLVKTCCARISLLGGVEVVLETEITNVGSLSLYTGLGFFKDKRLVKYYLNGVDAFRLKLVFSKQEESLASFQH